MPESVAVVIPVFNRPDLVVESLRSVQAQTRKPDLLVVVDDGSTDDTAQRIEKWIQQTTHRGFEARLIRQSNQGAAAARNRGSAEAVATGIEFLAFLDSDDVWPRDYLERTTKALRQNPQAVAVSVDRQDLDLPSGKSSLKRMSGLVQNATRTIFLEGPPGTPNTVIRTTAFSLAGGYEPAQVCGEDYQLLLRISLRGPWLYEPGRPVMVRRGDACSSPAEPPRLSRRYADRRLRLAKILDQFIFSDGGHEALPLCLWRKRLGRAWYSAGRQLKTLGRTQEARSCFQRAIEVQPWNLRARWRSLTLHACRVETPPPAPSGPAGPSDTGGSHRAGLD